MKQIYTILAGTLILLSSCSSTQKAAQTPDDIYYSPGASRNAAANSGDQPEYYSTAPSDQYVRMKSQDYNKWSYFDDYNAYDSYYASPSVSFGGYYGFGYPYYSTAWGFGPSYGMGLGFWDPYMCWNSYFMWNSWYNPYFYNPYYGGGVIVSHGPITNVYGHLRSFNGVSYRNGLASSGSGGDRFYRPSVSTNRNYVPANTRTTNNNTYYRPSNNNNNNNGFNRPTYSPAPTRSYTPMGGGGGGGGFSRPGIRH